MRITRLIAAMTGAVLLATSLNAQTPPPGGGRGGLPAEADVVAVAARSLARARNAPPA